jgi:hypothetical protein
MRQFKTPTVAEQLVSDSDHVQLSRLVMEHAWRTDVGRADTVHELYVEDGVLDLGTPLRGRKAIYEWGLKLVEAPPWRSIQHVCGSLRFLSDGPNNATGITYMIVFMVAGNDPTSTLPWSVGEDHDQYVRTPQGWRLRSRHWQENFARGDVLGLPLPELTGSGGCTT